MPGIDSAQLAKSGSEHGNQRAFFNELRIWSQPVHDHTFAIPNGRKRDKRDAGILKAEGVKAGVPDVMIAWPYGNFAGLFIELKKPTKGVVGTKQEDWHIRLVQRGYAVAVAYDWIEAINVVKFYFGQLPATAAIAGRFIRLE